MKKALIVLAVIFLMIGVSGQAGAAPIKWSQPPDWDYGYDILSGVDSGNIQIVADDWQCTDGLPITDLHWWGSYTEDTNPNVEIGLLSPATNFWIAVWSDVPATESITEYSHPGTLLGQSKVDGLTGYKDGYQTQAQHNGYKYEINLSDDPIFQDLGTIYWLSILATDESTWGWKTASTHNNDWAVKRSGFAATEDPPTDWMDIGTMETLGVDMAFDLNSNNPVPEPTTMMLLGSLATGLFGFAGLRRRFTRN